MIKGQRWLCISYICHLVKSVKKYTFLMMVNLQLQITCNGHLVSNVKMNVHELESVHVWRLIVPWSSPVAIRYLLKDSKRSPTVMCYTVSCIKSSTLSQISVTSDWSGAWNKSCHYCYGDISCNKNNSIFKTQNKFCKDWYIICTSPTCHHRA